MEPILEHTRITADATSPTHWLYVLHGIYGSGRNWGQLARRLVEAQPEWGVILVDLRLHGGSAGFTPPHSVAACAGDVAELERVLRSPADAVLGHSFGGKVALLRASANAGQRPAEVWVADSSLGAHAPAGEAWRVVEIVKELPDRFASRDDLVAALEAHGYEHPVGRWLAMNLEREGGEFVWRLDWAGVEAMLRDYFATDVWPIIESPPAGVEIHVIRATLSGAIDPSAVERLRRVERRDRHVHLHEVRASHWLNVDNPDAVLRLLSEQLGR